MSQLYYLAYGSNLHPVRLQKRVPSATLKGLVTVSGYKLCFHKRQQEDNSGKCNMLMTHREDDVVYGALYQMNSLEKPLLDQCEGEGYRCDSIKVEHQSQQYDCFVYIAEESHIDNSLRPHSWYHEIVLLGAEHHHLPEEYIGQIRAVTALDDPDIERQNRNRVLIEELRSFPKITE